MKYKSVLGKNIELTKERKTHILTYHPDLKPYFKLVKIVLIEPDKIKISKSDPNVLLFYRYFANIMKGKYIAVTVKLGQRSFILTAYLTNKMLSGEPYEKS